MSFNTIFDSFLKLKRAYEMRKTCVIKIWARILGFSDFRISLFWQTMPCIDFREEEAKSVYRSVIFSNIVDATNKENNRGEKRNG